ncbi:ImmA/IrrE family metallo-endopeptidase [Termitidicoccus mucosus]|uniref:IrrE N-terminal-like domain-containing protein n=1 Tax=Termitidicoccus mucosus TaxID=1184151 RepID=A0A178IMF3_9BACT|nr:hypothetical protein AW736_07860 [Opitutaceae bacterium TSB47]
MSPQNLKRIAAACADLGNRAADEGGFVALPRLTELLRAEVEFRPLLVEAMIAAPNGPGTWKVLVDSEAYPDGAKAFLMESPQAPLPARLRNTLAHELLHTLSFRAEEFGFKLELNGKETRMDAVKRLEKETEGFSPLLLLPQKVIESELESRGLSLDVLLDWRQRWTVSREVLVARLGLLQSLPEFRLRYHRGVLNVAVCLAEWVNDESTVLLEWPIYFNFRDGIVPEFLLQLRTKGKPALRDLFSESEFLLNGGEKRSTRNTLPAGTATNPRAEKLEIVADVESVPKRKGETFLIVFRSE